MEEYFFVMTFNTSLGKTKEIRVADANPDLTIDDLMTPVDNIMIANIFDLVTVGSLEVVKGMLLEKVEHTLYEY